MLIEKLQNSTGFLLNSSIDTYKLNTKHIVMDFTQKGNICKCKTRHATVGDKKGFIKNSKAFKGRPTCNFVSRRKPTLPVLLATQT